MKYGAIRRMEKLYVTPEHKEKHIYKKKG